MVYVDTNILIYLLENHPTYGKAAADTLTQYRDKGHDFVSSTITVTEFLAGTGAASASMLDEIAHLQFIGTDRLAAERAAKLIRTLGMNIGDAIHLATALNCQADIFFTNDTKLARAAKKHIKVKTLDK